MKDVFNVVSLLVGWALITYLGFQVLLWALII